MPMNVSFSVVKPSSRVAALFLIAVMSSMSLPAYCADMAAGEAESLPFHQRVARGWSDWPHSEKFKVTLEYRNYSYFEEESRGDSRDSINEGHLEVEYDTYVRDNMRLFIDAHFQVDDDDFTHGFVDDLEDDDIKRNYFNFTEAFIDIYFDTYDLRLGKQIVNWGKADSVNPTDNINPTDYSNLLDDEDIGVVAANFNYYWNEWNFQFVAVPGFTPTRFPPTGTRFSVIPPDSIFPVTDPELPSNTIDNAQVGVRLLTTYHGWDFSASYYDGVNDVPVGTLRFLPGPTVVPVYNRFRAIGGDFATTFEQWGFHGEAAQIIFDGAEQDSYFQYVLGVDYTKNNILFDQDLFVIVEYVGEDVTEKATGSDMGTSLDRVLTSAVAINVTWEFSDYTKLEVTGAYDFDQGDDYFFQPQLVHQMNDYFEITVGIDVIGGPKDTFLGQFKDNDRLFVKLKYAF